MLRIELEPEQTTDNSLLRVDHSARRQLAEILSDWLSVYAEVRPLALTRDKFDFVVELRRVLLSPDEGNCKS